MRQERALRARPRRRRRGIANARSSRSRPLSPTRVLILGGTSQASALARRLAAEPDIAATLSLAGATRNPAPSPIPTRVGGFGGAPGLAAYLGAERVDALIDATHPFAERISTNALAASEATRTPLAVLTRPPWTRQDGDRWIEVSTIDEAVDALGAKPRRVFLTQGRLRLAAFARAPRHVYLVRAIDPPEAIAALPEHRLILGRGPFTLEEETALMRSERIEALVTKNSGGEATYAKIEAARRLGVVVIMLRRPQAAKTAEIADIEAAVAWIRAHRRAP